MLTAYAEHRISQVSTYRALQSIKPCPRATKPVPLYLATTRFIVNIKKHSPECLRECPAPHLTALPCLPRCNNSVSICLSSHVSHRRSRRNDLSIQARSHTTLFLYSLLVVFRVCPLYPSTAAQFLTADVPVPTYVTSLA